MITCKSCGGHIWWAITEANGKLMPIDAGGNPEGNVERTGRMRPTRHGSAPEVRVIAHGQLSLPGADQPLRFMPHHATCTNSDEWRDRT